MHRRLPRLLFAIIVTLSLNGCVSLLDADGQKRRDITARVDGLLAEDILAPAQVGIVVRAVATGETIYASNAGKQMTPASNMKLVTAAASLLGLGLDFRFETRLVPEREVEDGTVTGNLYVIADGDPTIRKEFDREPSTIFAGWASALHAAGVRRIEDNLMCVESWPAGATYGSYGDGWAWDDLAWAYAAPASQIQAGGNRVIMRFEPDPQMPSGVGWSFEPDMYAPTIYVNDIRMSDSNQLDIRLAWRPYRANTPSLMGLNIEGKVQSDTLPLAKELSIRHPTFMYARMLAAEFSEAGISLPKGVTCVPSRYLEKFRHAPLPEPVLVDRSPPLTEILSFMLKSSDNLVAETLIRALGAKAAAEFSFAAGKGAARGVLLPLGIDLDTMRYADGSGLSRYNHVSAMQITDLLLAMMRGGGRTAQIWKSLLPVAGRDGTLKNHFKATALEGNLVGKSGSMSSIRALSGYFTAASGEDYVFSILVNGHLATGRQVDRELEELLLSLYANL